MLISALLTLMASNGFGVLIESDDTVKTLATSINSAARSNINNKCLIKKNIDILLEEARTHPNANIALSPEGFHQLFYAVQLGSTDNTKTLLNSVLGNFEPSKNVASTNVLLAEKRITPATEYLEKLKKINGAYTKVDVYDQNSCSQAVSEVNNICAKKTNNMISEVLNLNDLFQRRFFTLALVNALYFNESWETPFSGSLTAHFNVDSSTSIEVPMMEEELQVAYSKTNTFTAVAIPYQRKELNSSSQTFMLVLLPTANNHNISSEELLEAINTLYSIRSHSMVTVTLPIFKITKKDISLLPYLENMGLKELTRKMDMQVTGNPTAIKIDSITQNLVIDVNQIGTKAAATTSMLASDSCDPDASSFRCDRPFFYFIVDNWNQNEPPRILFSGQIKNPSLEQ